MIRINRKIWLAVLSLFICGMAEGQGQLQVNLNYYYELDGAWQPLGGMDFYRSAQLENSLPMPGQILLDEGAPKIKLEFTFRAGGELIDPLRLIVRPFSESMTGYASLEQKRVHPSSPVSIVYYTRDIYPYNQFWVQVYLPEAYQRQWHTTNQSFVIPFKWAPISGRPSQGAEAPDSGLAGYDESGGRAGSFSETGAAGSEAEQAAKEEDALQSLYSIELYAGTTPPNVFTIRREAGIGGVPYFEKTGDIYRARVGFFTSPIEASEALSQIIETFPEARLIQETGHFANPEMHRGAYAENMLKLEAPSIAAVAETPDPVFHTVKKGETLFGISRQYDVPLEDIRRRNNFEGHEVIIPGQKVRIR